LEHWYHGADRLIQVGWVEHAAVGTEIEVGKLDGYQKRIPAVLLSFPFYDPQKTKPRS
jgi:aminomethyltransferase